VKRILIVEDQHTQRVIIRKMLESFGFHVDEAADGVECLRYCREQQIPNGILLDINMPRMDGLECLSQLRADHALRDCQIVMCTTMVEQEQIAAAVAAGANEYVMKPFTEDILRDKLRSVGLLA
jgi:two-component system chemotaxis response regulator CheY